MVSCTKQSTTRVRPSPRLVPSPCASALSSILAVLALAARILVEERFLAEKLEGYDAYRKRVRYRLIPLFW